MTKGEDKQLAIAIEKHREPIDAIIEYYRTFNAGFKLKFIPEKDPNELLVDGIVGELWFYTAHDSLTFSEIYSIISETVSDLRQDGLKVSNDVMIRTFKSGNGTKLKFGILVYTSAGACKKRGMNEGFEGCR